MCQDKARVSKVCQSSTHAQLGSVEPPKKTVIRTDMIQTSMVFKYLQCFTDIKECNTKQPPVAFPMEK